MKFLLFNVPIKKILQIRFFIYLSLSLSQTEFKFKEIFIIIFFYVISIRVIDMFIW